MERFEETNNIELPQRLNRFEELIYKSHLGDLSDEERKELTLMKKNLAAYTEKVTDRLIDRLIEENRELRKAENDKLAA